MTNDIKERNSECVECVRCFQNLLFKNFNLKSFFRSANKNFIILLSIQVIKISNKKNKTMKKLVLTLALAIGLCSFASAQSGKNALGFNLGLGGLNPEVSYVRALSSSNALDFSLGLDLSNNDFGISLAGFYDWNFNIVGGLGWYVGPGVWLGYTNEADQDLGNGMVVEGDSHFGIGVGANIGLSYKFNLPISLGLQYGLRTDFTDFDNTWLFDGFGVSVRYHF